MKTISKSIITGLLLISIIPNTLSAIEVPPSKDCGTPYKYNKTAKKPTVKVTRNKVTDHRKKPRIIIHDHRKKASRKVKKNTHKRNVHFTDHRSKAPRSIKRKTTRIKIVPTPTSKRASQIIGKHIVKQHTNAKKTTKKVLKKATEPLSSGIKKISSIF